MTDDLGRYQRMADRAAERKRVREEREHSERQRRAAEYAAMYGPTIPRMDGESEPMDWADDEHLGHRAHGHPAHAWANKCSCGALLGVGSYVIDESFVPPERCPICDAHAASREKGRPE